jgi:hypothetical protein
MKRIIAVCLIAAFALFRIFLFSKRTAQGGKSGGKA